MPKALFCVFVNKDWALVSSFEKESSIDRFSWVCCCVSVYKNLFLGHKITGLRCIGAHTNGF